MYMYLSVSLSLYFCMSDLHLVVGQVHNKISYMMYRVLRTGLQKLLTALQHWTNSSFDQGEDTRTKATIVSYSAKSYTYVLALNYRI